MKNRPAPISTAAFSAACAVLFSVLASGCSISVTRPGTAEFQFTVGKAGTTEYRCVLNSSGECAYLLYTKACQPGSSPEGRERFVCTYEVIEQFTLAEGKSKLIETNGRQIKECTGTGAIPKLTDCLK